MKVKELRERLSKLDDKTDIVVYWEEGSEHQYFGIDDVSLTRGTPRRHADGKPGFAFDSKGPAARLFITVSPE
jgi:hypothetical protein